MCLEVTCFQCRAYLVGCLYGRGHSFCLQKSRMSLAGLVYFDTVWAKRKHHHMEVFHLKSGLFGEIN